MNTKLIMVEGLPGSGKSTIANMVADILTQRGITAQLFQEGDIHHPADYEGVAYYTQEEFEDLLVSYVANDTLLKSYAMLYEEGFLIPYEQIRNEVETDDLEGLMHELATKDIYELPYEQNVNLIVKKWSQFASEQIDADNVVIFECCFMQNPLTVGTVKYNIHKKDVIQYVLQLEETIKRLHPLLIYIDQQDIRSVFAKAVQERSKEWSDGFIQYYTNQGLGKMKGYDGFEGTLQVLRERKDIELEIYDLLHINKHKIDNSQYDITSCRAEIENILYKLL